ncbi:MAG: LD-carboxypeptidase, partial [Bacteroidetes bacterium]|nr:LD-carboxypeptidase [Bacteroidota bacterium]
FQELLDDPEVRAIVCLRGGYGTVRMVDRLDWSTFKHQPKWVVGYSDITVLHAHLHQLGFRSMHAAMPVQFPGAATPAQSTCGATPAQFPGSAMPDQSTSAATPVQSTSAAMPVQSTSGATPAQGPETGGVPAHWCAWLNLLMAPDHKEAQEWNHFPWSSRCHVARAGTLDGILIGGNLSVLYSLLGSRSFPDLMGKVLFLEDVDEYLYHIDRMLTALKRAGMLKDLSGLLVGDFTGMKDHSISFGSTWEEIILESVATYHYPVIFGVPAGHGDENWPLEMGIRLQSLIHKSSIPNTQVFNP